MFVNNLFQVSSANKQDFVALCDQLKIGHENSPWKPFFANNSCEMGEKYDEINEFNAYNMVETTSEESDVHMSDDIFLRKGKQQPSENVADVCKLHTQEDPAGIEKELQENVLKLKKELDSIQEGHPVNQICPGLELFCSISPHQVPFVCGILDVSSMNEMTVAVILNSLLNLELTVSLVTAASIICHIVYRKVQQLTSSASRTFTCSILMFAEKYPKAVVNELIIPCLNDNLIGSIQADLMQKLIKCSLPDYEVLRCCREVLNAEEPNENTFSTLQCIVERKINGDSTFYQVLLEKLLQWSKSHGNSMKFSKLLLSVTSIYGNQVIDEQKVLLGNIAENVTTFLKKGIENFLKKL